MKGAKIAVRTCMGIKPRENVLVITDPPRYRIANALANAAREANAEVVVMVMRTLTKHGEEPPETVVRAMRNVDVVLAPTTYSLTHTQARLHATVAGARIATMPMITESMMSRGAMLADYRKVSKLTTRVARLLNRADEAEVTTKAGTNLSFGVSGRSAQPDTGIFHEPGDFGNLPAGEAFIAPVEGTGEGEVVVDGSMMDRVRGVIRLKFEKGIATEIRGNKNLVKMLDETGGNSRNLAEFGIGTNHKARLMGNVLEDEKVLGTCHVALGDNSTFGGKIMAGIHLDGIILRPTVKLDGKILMENGRLKV